MRAIPVKLFGEEYKAHECTSCGTRTINLEAAMKLHEKIAPKINCEKKVIKIGESSAITIPKELKRFFFPGSIVSLNFDPYEMAITIKKQ